MQVHDGVEEGVDASEGFMGNYLVDGEKQSAGRDERQHPCSGSSNFPRILKLLQVIAANVAHSLIAVFKVAGARILQRGWKAV